jgi:sugar phosphate isomerase/epimerase
MQFGIMAMQIRSLIPHGLAPGDLIGHIYTFSTSNLVRELVAVGFNLIELSGDLPMFLPQTYDRQEIKQLRSIKEDMGVNYTLHLPLWSIEPSTPQAAVRAGSLRALVDMIKITEELEPLLYVHHATGRLAAEFYRMNLPEAAQAVLMRQFQDNAKESIKSLLSETGILSRQLAIETIEFPFDLTLEIAQELDTSICFDTGHVLAGFSGPVDFFAALDQCLSRLGEVHLHDGPWQGPDRNIGYEKDHQPLGSGDLDVPRLIDMLIGANFTGPIVFELTVEQAMASLEVIRTLRPDVL